MATTNSEKYETGLSNLSYINKDFQTIYPEFLDLAKELSYKWDPTISNESDPGVVLLKLCAIMADKNNYNIDQNILECFPETVSQLYNAVPLFQQLGYSMKWYRGATTTIGMQWITTEADTAEIKDKTITIPQFTMISDENQELIYTITESKELKIQGDQISLPAIQGTVVDYTVNGNYLITARDLDSNNRIYFPNYYVAQNGIFITVASDNNYSSWTQVDNLSVESLGKRVYKFGINKKATNCYIEFPSDIEDLMGEGLNIKYIVTQGAEGQSSKNVLTQLYTPISQEVVEDKEISLSTSNLLIVNAASSAGYNPETIEEAYKNYQKTIGVFNTLVTLRDYTNFINSTLRVSNAVVSDRTNDIQSSYKIVTKQGDLITRRLYITKSSLITLSSIQQAINNIVTAAVNAGVRGEDLKTITTAEITNLIEDVPDIYPFDLKLCAMQYIDTPNTAVKYNASFVVLDNTSNSTSNAISEIINTDLADVKDIQHDFIPQAFDKICMLKNKYPLNIRIVPKYKLDTLQQSQVSEAIRKSLFETLNASEVAFGDEISYSDVYDTIAAADERIKSVVLDDISYSTYAVYPTEIAKDKTSYTLYKEICISNDYTKRYIVGHYYHNVYSEKTATGTTYYRGFGKFIEQVDSEEDWSQSYTHLLCISDKYVVIPDSTSKVDTAPSHVDFDKFIKAVQNEKGGFEGEHCKGSYFLSKEKNEEGSTYPYSYQLYNDSLNVSESNVTGINLERDATGKLWYKPQGSDAIEYGITVKDEKEFPAMQYICVYEKDTVFVNEYITQGAKSGWAIQEYSDKINEFRTDIYAKCVLNGNTSLYNKTGDFLYSLAQQFTNNYGEVSAMSTYLRANCGNPYIKNSNDNNFETDFPIEVNETISSATAKEYNFTDGKFLCYVKPYTLWMECTDGSGATDYFVESTYNSVSNTDGGTFNTDCTATITDELKRKLGISDTTIKLVNSATDNTTKSPKEYGYVTLADVYFTADDTFENGAPIFDGKFTINKGDKLISTGSEWRKGTTHWTTLTPVKKNHVSSVEISEDRKTIRVIYCAPTEDDNGNYTIRGKIGGEVFKPIYTVGPVENLKYNIRSNENIVFAAPNLINKKVFGASVLFQAKLATSYKKSTIRALSTDEQLTLFWKDADEDSSYQYYKLVNKDIFSASISIPNYTDYETGMNKFIPYLADSLPAGQGTVSDPVMNESIAKLSSIHKSAYPTTLRTTDKFQVKTAAEVKITDVTKKCYWIVPADSEGNRVFFAADETVHILGPSEYFVYAVNDGQTLSILGEGTKIERAVPEGQSCEEWKLHVTAAITLDQLAANDTEALQGNWFTIDNKYTVTATEMQFVTLGSNTQLIIKPEGVVSINDSTIMDSAIKNWVWTGKDGWLYTTSAEEKTFDCTFTLLTDTDTTKGKIFKEIIVTPREHVSSEVGKIEYVDNDNNKYTAYENTGSAWKWTKGFNQIVIQNSSGNSNELISFLLKVSSVNNEDTSPNGTLVQPLETIKIFSHNKKSFEGRVFIPDTYKNIKYSYSYKELQSDGTYGDETEISSLDLGDSSWEIYSALSVDINTDYPTNLLDNQKVKLFFANETAETNYARILGSKFESAAVALNYNHTIGKISGEKIKTSFYNDNGTEEYLKVYRYKNNKQTITDPDNNYTLSIGDESTIANVKINVYRTLTMDTNGHLSPSGTYWGELGIQTDGGGSHYYVWKKFAELKKDSFLAEGTSLNIGSIINDEILTEEKTIGEGGLYLSKNSYIVPGSILKANSEVTPGSFINCTPYKNKETLSVDVSITNNSWTWISTGDLCALSTEPFEFALEKGKYLLPIYISQSKKGGDHDTVELQHETTEDTFVSYPLLGYAGSTDLLNGRPTNYVQFECDGKTEDGEAPKPIKLRITGNFLPNVAYYIKLGRPFRYTVQEKRDKNTYNITIDEFEKIFKRVQELDIDNLYDYLYEVDPDEKIKYPLDASSFLLEYHPYNAFTICQLDTANSDLQITNKIK